MRGVIKEDMIEETLRQVAFLQEGEKKEVLLSELARHLEEAINTLFDLLFQGEPALIHVALQVIQRIKYPQNEAALSALLWLVAYGDASLHQEALHLLVSMGPQILPHLVQMTDDDSELDSLLQDALIGAEHDIFNDYRNEVKHDTEYLIRILIDTLAPYPEHVVPFLTYVLSRALKDWWEIAIQVANAIGYPRNGAVLPLIIEHACMLNNPAEREADHVLQTIGPEALLPYFVDALWNKGKADSYGGAGVWHVCARLLSEGWHADLVLCGPTIAYLLGQPSSAIDENTTNILLRALERIGNQCAVYALPALIALIQREGTNTLGLQARHLIDTFDPMVVAPYSRLIASFETNGL